MARSGVKQEDEDEFAAKCNPAAGSESGDQQSTAHGQTAGSEANSSMLASGSDAQLSSTTGGRKRKSGLDGLIIDVFEKINERVMTEHEVLQMLKVLQETVDGDRRFKRFKHWSSGRDLHSNSRQAVDDDGDVSESKTVAFATTSKAGAGPGETAVSTEVQRARIAAVTRVWPEIKLKRQLAEAPSKAADDLQKAYRYIVKMKDFFGEGKTDVRGTVMKLWDMLSLKEPVKVTNEGKCEVGKVADRADLFRGILVDAKSNDSKSEVFKFVEDFQIAVEYRSWCGEPAREGGGKTGKEEADEMLKTLKIAHKKEAGLRILLLSYAMFQEHVLGIAFLVAMGFTVNSIRTVNVDVIVALGSLLAWRGFPQGSVQRGLPADQAAKVDFIVEVWLRRINRLVKMCLKEGDRELLPDSVMVYDGHLLGLRFNAVINKAGEKWYRHAIVMPKAQLLIGKYKNSHLDHDHLEKPTIFTDRLQILLTEPRPKQRIPPKAWAALRAYCDSLPASTRCTNYKELDPSKFPGRLQSPNSKAYPDDEWQTQEQEANWLFAFVYGRYEKVSGPVDQTDHGKGKDKARTKEIRTTSLEFVLPDYVVPASSTSEAGPHNVVAGEEQGESTEEGNVEGEKETVEAAKGPAKDIAKEVQAEEGDDGDDGDSNGNEEPRRG